MLSLYALAVAAAGHAAEAGPPFPRIANCYGVGLAPGSTPKDIEEIARFDLLIGGVWCNWADAEQRKKLADNMAAVRAKNPHVIILDFSSSAPYADPKDATFPATGWLLQPDGKHILGWPGTEMINLAKPEVIDWLAKRSVASVKEKGFDGSFIDCMGSGFDWWACNIEHGEPYQIDVDGDGKADDRAWLDAEWVKAKTELARRVREALGPEVPFMTNQAGDWGLPYMNGILLEDYLDYVLAGTLAWDNVLADYLRWTAAPHKPNVTTIVSSSGIEPPYDPWRTMTEEARNAMLERGRALLPRMRFGLATTLMGDGYFAYDLHTRWRGQRWWYPEYDAPLGYPLGPAAKQADGTWRREFDGGTVIVNPTLFDAVVRLPARHRDASSGKVDTSFVIASQDGRILLPTDEAVAAGSIPDPQPIFSLAGPETVLDRGDRLLVRLQGVAAVLDAQGRLLRLTDGERTWMEGLRAFVVSNDRWRDFDYADCKHEVMADGSLRFTGRRTEGEVAVAYEEGVKAEAQGLAITFRWQALTAAHFHMFRLQADFPVDTYGDGRFAAGTAVGPLPADRAPEPRLAGPFRAITLAPPAGRAISVESSLDAQLVDERHYGVQAFRLGHYPTWGDVAAGSESGMTLHIRLH
jgi:Hypothetical glycosyl hydrolase family 15